MGIYTRTIKLNVLTPIWTGGATKAKRGHKMDRVHETAILGSLRWWYELFVRGNGGKACDPSADSGRCLLKVLPDENQRDIVSLRNAGLCDVCQLFGATGWRRQFNLTVDASGLQYENPPPDFTLTHEERPITHRTTNRPREWILGPGLGDGTMTIALSATDQGILDVIEMLLYRAASWGAIGARTQMGYGVVDAPIPQNAAPFDNRMSEIRQHPIHQPGYYNFLPRLDRLFSYTAQLPNQPVVTDRPVSTIVKELLHTKVDIRDLFRATEESQQQKDQRHRIMGEVDRQNRNGARINISRPYQDQDSNELHIRIWGWASVDDFKLVRQRLEDHLAGRKRPGSVTDWWEWGWRGPQSPNARRSQP